MTTNDFTTSVRVGLAGQPHRDRRRVQVTAPVNFGSTLSAAVGRPNRDRSAELHKAPMAQPVTGCPCRSTTTTRRPIWP